MARLPIVATGLANVASVAALARRIGQDPVVLSDPGEIEHADALVVPGVGAFGPAMGELAARELLAPLRRRLERGRPTLAICLGMQLLAASSDESPGAPGLGLLDGHVSRLVAGPHTRVPRLGWAFVEPSSEMRVAAGHAYFAHSYALERAPSGWNVAYADGYVAAIERGRVLACQFHPELSGPWGRDLVLRWLTGEGPAPSDTGGRRPRRSGASRVIPCLDLKDGRVVKGVRFQGLRDVGDPVELARRYEDDGADELVLLDVSATLEGRLARLSLVEAVRRALAIPLTIGGGIATVADATALFEAGADRVAVNSAAVREPSLVDALAARFGRQSVVGAIDAVATASRGSGTAPAWEVVVQSGTERTGLDVLEWARELARRGAGELLLTSHDRDGTGEGFDLDLYGAVSRAVDVPIIASGGARTPEHMSAVLERGASAVLAASILHDDRMSVIQIKRALATMGIEVRS